MKVLKRPLVLGAVVLFGSLVTWPLVGGVVGYGAALSGALLLLYGVTAERFVNPRLARASLIWGPLAVYGLGLVGFGFWIGLPLAVTLTLVMVRDLRPVVMRRPTVAPQASLAHVVADEHQSPRNRARALLALADQDPMAAEELARVWLDGDKHSALLSASLEILAPEPMVLPLAKRLSRRPELFHKMGDPDVDALILSLLKVFATHRCERGVEFAEHQLLQHSMARVQRSAARALGKMGAVDQLPTLQRMARKSKERGVVQACRVSIMKLTDPEAPHRQVARR